MPGSPWDKAVRDAEFAEAEYVFAMAAAAPEEIRTQLGVTATRIGAGVAIAMRQDPSGWYWNRALAMGLRDPITPSSLDTLIEFYRACGAPMLVLPLAPAADRCAGLLAERGFRPGVPSLKFLRDSASGVPEVNGPAVRRVAPEEAGRYGDTYCQAYQYPVNPALRRFVATHASGAPWVAFGVEAEGRLTAVAASFDAESGASLCGAGTLPGSRGRGAQSALIAARIRAAIESGHRWIYTETWAETRGPNPSLHNAIRLGFTQLYQRQSWCLRF